MNPISISLIYTFVKNLISKYLHKDKIIPYFFYF